MGSSRYTEKMREEKILQREDPVEVAHDIDMSSIGGDVVQIKEVAQNTQTTAGTAYHIRMHCLHACICIFVFV